MNRNRRLSFLLALTLGLVACQSIAGDPRFRLSLKVIDDTGAPVAGSHVRLGAERRPKGEESGGKGVFVEGQTDEKGLFSGEIEAWNATRAGYQVEKEGHYGVWLTYRANPPVLGKWQPWNPMVEVVLKRKRNPVPMYAKRVETKIPEFQKSMGYDLVRGDWVDPYGKGVVSDLVLEAERQITAGRNYTGTLALKFSNEADGLIPMEIDHLQGSGLRMPYHAPESGYVTHRKWREIRHPNADGQDTVISDTSGKMNYFMRIRTVKDESGSIVSAMYGKIHGDIRWLIGTQSLKSGLIFTYYLNPDGTRNIEFDPTRNLFKPAKRDDPAFRSLEP